jgi:hypothetical protein
MEQIKTKTLAEIYLKQGHLQEAYEIFESLAKRDPGDREIGERLRILSQKLGLVTSSAPPGTRSKEEMLRTLVKWLVNIQTRRMK